ncbi:MAG: sensor histidine kinase [Pseudomonadota bacterium]
MNGYIRRDLIKTSEAAGVLAVRVPSKLLPKLPLQSTIFSAAIVDRAIPRRMLAEATLGLTEGRSAVLLQELQHRMANSLQIIASILMQSAREATSEEARSQLNQVHQRVLTLATLQRSLVGSGDDRVLLDTYFAAVGQSISLSLIPDGNALEIQIYCEPVTVDATVATSLGLVLTELVINSIKHAFPSGKHGAVVVEFSGTEAAWVLTVADNGIGMPAETKLGQGSRLVRALASQLDAGLTVCAAMPGTRTVLTHSSD